MKATKENVNALHQLAASSTYNKELINDVIQLYQDRKIERLDTAKCIINNLASRGLQRQNKGIDKLDYYKNVYVSRSEKYNIKAISDFSNEYNSYTKYKKAKCKAMQQLAASSKHNNEQINDLKQEKLYVNRDITNQI